VQNAPGLLAVGFVERSLQIHVEMRLAFASPAAKIPARKLHDLFLLDALGSNQSKSFVK
jgi:hypothetical protein